MPLAHQGIVTLDRAGRKVVETKSMEERRLSVRLDYGDGEIDSFSWELFTPNELADRARRFGLHLVDACSGFDETTPPSAERPRFQALCLLPQPIDVAYSSALANMRSAVRSRSADVVCCHQKSPKPLSQVGPDGTVRNARLAIVYRLGLDWPATRPSPTNVP